MKETWGHMGRSSGRVSPVTYRFFVSKSKTFSERWNKGSRSPVKRYQIEVLRGTEVYLSGSSSITLKRPGCG